MPAEAPSFAVVVPVFNGADALRRCVASVQAQAANGSGPEIVVADDASTDDMSAVFDELRDEGIVVVRQTTNRGPAAARNLGAAATTAEWLVFLDSDDELAPGALRDLSAAISPTTGLVRARYARREEPDAAAPTTFLAGTFAVRHDVFDAAEGYDEYLRFSENSELRMRVDAVLGAQGLEDRSIGAITAVVSSVGQSRNYDEARMHAAIRILDQHPDHFAADAHERATYEAIASVNATRTRQWGIARRYAWRALRSEPRQLRHGARFARSLLGPLGQRVDKPGGNNGNPDNPL